MNQNKTALLILGIITVIAVAGLVLCCVQDNKSTALGAFGGYSQSKIYGGAIKKWNEQHSYVSYSSLFDEQGNMILPQKSAYDG